MQWMTSSKVFRLPILNKKILLIYKVEAFQEFKQMGSELNKDIVSFLSHSSIPHSAGECPTAKRSPRKD